jgi:hypothetical protein
MNYIGPIVDSLKGTVPPAARRRLKLALATVMGTEAVIAARDIGGATVEETLAVSAWAARALVREALAEADRAPGRRPR